ncbi:MAG: twin-arginine translocase subunit TatC [Candidatus Krumholzibacteria bacterium]|nr:twin-arginine translocase subunit TatC [Candidatus Krumholzibacteria bacterium]
MKTLPDTKPNDKEPLKEMSFLEHLTELRRTIIQSLIVLFGLSIVVWVFSGRVLDFLVEDLPVDSLYFQTPLEAFMVRMKVSLILGLMLAFPFILFKIWSFIAPGLFSYERSRIYPLMVSSSLLFYIGVLFCYLILIPIVLRFLIGFGTEYLNPLLSVSSYFGFVARLCFVFGVVFQVPIVVLVLSSLGIVTPRFLLRQWRYGVLIIFVGSAALTPPDAISLLLMALPILLLYISSILVALVVVRKKRDRARRDIDRA